MVHATSSFYFEDTSTPVGKTNFRPLTLHPSRYPTQRVVRLIHRLKLFGSLTYELWKVIGALRPVLCLYLKYRADLFMGSSLASGLSSCFYCMAPGVVGGG